MKTTETGDLGKAMVIADAMKRGYTVSVPLSENIRYDLVVDRHGRLERVQCKATRSNGEVVIVKCRSTSSWAGKTRQTHKYTAADVDWIVTYDVTSDACYFIPAEMLGKGRCEIKLRLVPPKNNRKKGLNFARDFTAW